MSTTQQRAIAAGFLHAMKDPDVLAKWDKAKSSHEQLSSLIADTMGLKDKPTKDDIKAMHDYAEESLQKQHAELREAQPNAPHSVGFAFTSQQ